MSSDPFTLLGLDRTSATEADVRRAYAERLKVTRPEDDREAFMALREAFERARREARWRQEYAEEEEAEAATPVATFPPAPSDAAISGTRSEPGSAADDDEDYEEDYEEDDYVPSDFDKRIDGAMQTLQQALTSPWGPPASTELQALLNNPDLEGIDEYRAMQWQLRNFLCNATGYYSETQEVVLPSWLTLQVFDDLDAQFGWVRQPSSQAVERYMNAWLRQVRDKLYWLATPYEERVKKERERLLGRTATQSSSGDDFGSLIWLLAGAGLLISVVLRGLTGFGS